MNQPTLWTRDLTQTEQIHQALTNRWTCGTEMLRMGIPRYAARIWELNHREPTLGRITKRRCANPHHAHRSTQYEWRLNETA